MTHTPRDRSQCCQTIATIVISVLSFLLLIQSASPTFALGGAKKSIDGHVVDKEGNGVGGVMVSAIDAEQRKWTSVFTDPNGRFSMEGLRDVPHSQLL